MKREHLAHFKIAGFTYYEGAICFNELTIGTALRLELEESNRYDPRAVAIYFNEHKLGFIPRDENRIFYKILKVGLDCIDCRVQTVDKSAKPEDQIGVVLHLTNKDD